MGYKLTWVYIRPNGTEQKIRPNWFHYEVDFTQLSALPAEWTATTWGTVVNGSWLQAETLAYMSVDLTSANLLEMEMTWTRTETSWAWWDKLWVGDWANWSSWYNEYYFMALYSSNYSYHNQWSFLESNIWWTNTNLAADTWKTPRWWDYTYTFSIDFSTGVMSWTQYDSLSGNTNNPTYTLSSSQISDIKNYGYVRIYNFNPNGVTNYIKTVSIDIT